MNIKHLILLLVLGLSLYEVVIPPKGDSDKMQLVEPYVDTTAVDTSTIVVKPLKRPKRKAGEPLSEVTYEDLEPLLD